MIDEILAKVELRKSRAYNALLEIKSCKKVACPLYFQYQVSRSKEK